MIWINLEKYKGTCFKMLRSNSSFLENAIPFIKPNMNMNTNVINNHGVIHICSKDISYYSKIKHTSNSSELRLI